MCLSAASEKESERQAARALVDGMIERTGWTPHRIAVFAGALRYTAYGPLVRFIMKRISASEGQSTDTTRDHEYTDWDQVDAFADAFAENVLFDPTDSPTPATG